MSVTSKASVMLSDQPAESQAKARRQCNKGLDKLAKAAKMATKQQGLS